jgi:hypothetical protein
MLQTIGVLTRGDWGLTLDRLRYAAIAVRRCASWFAKEKGERS